MKKVKIIALILVLAMAGFMLTACGGSDSSAPPSSSADAGASESPAPSQAAPASDAGGGETFVMRIGTGTGGRHHQNVWMEAYKEALEAATDGRIEVQLYPAGQLGTMIELVQGIVDGSIEAGCFPATYFSIIMPEVACLDLAFTFKDAEQLWRILYYEDTMYQKAFEDNGIVIGAWLRNADRTILSNFQINSIDDLKGKVMWCIPSRVIQEEVTLLGGTPSGIDTGEVAPAIQNGTVDGSVQDITLYRAQNLHTAGAKYMLDAPTGALITAFGVSQIWWDKLPADLQKIVGDVAKQVVIDVQYPYVEEYCDDALETMIAEGMEVIEPSAQLVSDLRDALAPQVEWFMGQTPSAKPMYDELLQFVANDK